MVKHIRLTVDSERARDFLISFIEALAARAAAFEGCSR